MLINKIINKIRKPIESADVYCLDFDKAYCAEHIQDTEWFALHTGIICISYSKKGSVLFIYRTKELRDNAYILAKQRYGDAVKLIDKTLGISKVAVDEYDKEHGYIN